jgi:hypothetical protein
MRELVEQKGGPLADTPAFRQVEAALGDGPAAVRGFARLQPAVPVVLHQLRGGTAEADGWLAGTLRDLLTPVKDAGGPLWSELPERLPADPGVAGLRVRTTDQGWELLLIVHRLRP